MMQKLYLAQDCDWEYMGEQVSGTIWDCWGRELNYSVIFSTWNEGILCGNADTKLRNLSLCLWTLSLDLQFFPEQLWARSHEPSHTEIYIIDTQGCLQVNTLNFVVLFKELVSVSFWIRGRVCQVNYYPAPCSISLCWDELDAAVSVTLR